jgi:TetR/AcrR family transcriptional regulator, transcriptional repressor for nem operon
MPKTKQFDEAAVLDKARDVFWKQGYNGSSMEELVKATGLSRSSIYDSFGDKHGLFTKTLEHYRQAQQQLMQEGMPPGFSARKRIGWLFQNNIAESLGDRQRKGCFILNSTTELANMDNSINKFVVSNMAAMEELLYKWVKEGQADGSISKKFGARALARNLYSSFNGLKVVGQTKPDKAALDEIMKVALSVLD